MVTSYPHVQATSWRTTPFWLFTIVYSIYSQLPSVPGSCLLYLQHQNIPCSAVRDPLTMV